MLSYRKFLFKPKDVGVHDRKFATERNGAGKGKEILVQGEEGGGGKKTTRKNKIAKRRGTEI
jgi:hypothetical protein